MSSRLIDIESLTKGADHHVGLYMSSDSIVVDD